MKVGKHSCWKYFCSYKVKSKNNMLNHQQIFSVCTKCCYFLILCKLKSHCEQYIVNRQYYVRSICSLILQFRSVIYCRSIVKIVSVSQSHSGSLLRFKRSNSRCSKWSSLTVLQCRANTLRATLNMCSQASLAGRAVFRSMNTFLSIGCASKSVRFVVVPLR